MKTTILLSILLVLGSLSALAGDGDEGARTHLFDVRDLLEVDGEIVDVLCERAKKAGLEVATPGRGKVQITGTAEQVAPLERWLAERREKKLARTSTWPSAEAIDRLRASNAELKKLLHALEREMQEVRQARAEAQEAGEERRDKELEQLLHELELKFAAQQERRADLARHLQALEQAGATAGRKDGTPRQDHGDRDVEKKRKHLKNRLEMLRHILPYLRELEDRDQVARTERQIAEIEAALAGDRREPARDGHGSLQDEVRALRGEVRELKALVMKLLERR